MREISKLRKTDEKNSNIVTEWLEKNLYSVHTTEYSKKDDLENQIKGIDCTFKIDGIEYKCDEKAAVAFINKPLHTFAFELSFINKFNQIQDGWLLNDDLETDIYGLVWIDKAKSNILTSIDDIEEVTTAYIKKKDILQYLEDLGWSIDNLYRKSDAIRENNGDVYMGNIFKNGCKFAYSKQLVEKPINVLIPREKLIEMKMF